MQVKNYIIIILVAKQRVRLATKWEICNGVNWVNMERSPDTYGPVIQVLRKSLMIVYGTKVTPYIVTTITINRELMLKPRKDITKLYI